MTTFKLKRYELQKNARSEHFADEVQSWQPLSNEHRCQKFLRHSGQVMEPFPAKP